MKPVPGKCNAKVCVGDDYGDGSRTLFCQLSPSHLGRHEFCFGEDPDCPETKRSHKVEITWLGDDNIPYLEDTAWTLQKDRTFLVEDIPYEDEEETAEYWEPYDPLAAMMSDTLDWLGVELVDDVCRPKDGILHTDVIDRLLQAGAKVTIAGS